MTQNNEREMIEEVSDIKSADWNRFAQTNNEREAFEKYETWLCTLNSFSPAEMNFGFLAWKARAQSPISHNEQQEVVGYIDEFGNFENSLKQWMIDETDVKWKPLYTSPKQIPDGWKLVPIEITEDMHVAAVKTILKCTGNDDFPRRVYKAMLNAAPTTTLTSETNTEVGG